jgi:hypothetical protein
MSGRYGFLAALAFLLAAGSCSGSGGSDKVKITFFQAAPDLIEVGQSTKLLFVADPSDAQLSITGVGDVTGRTQTIVAPTTTTTYHLTATKGTATDDIALVVTVTAHKTVGFKLTPASNTPTAGQALAVTVTAIDAGGATASGFHGTVHVTSSDTAAVLPADIVFAPSDAGVKQTTVTLKTAGLGIVTATDTVNAGTRGTAAVTVQPGAGIAYELTALPSSATAGQLLVLSIVVLDAFGNVATGYAGQASVTSTDATDVLPATGGFIAGMRTVSLEFTKAGSHTATVSEVAANITPVDTNAVNVTHAAASRILLALPADANAGYAVTAGVAIKDAFGNLVTDYARTVTFFSSDAGTGSAPPAPLTFTGSEGGVGSVSVTFVSLGTQVLAASDSGTPSALGSAASNVHGLMYTNPDTGRVRLVANTVQSNTNLVQLDLIANERLVISTFFGGGPGSSAVGMNLPLDTTRVGADSTLFLIGNALPVGTGTPIAMATIGATDHVLYTVVARKRVTGTVFTQVTEVQAGQVFYSVRLKLQPTAVPGPVFDGAQPSPLFVAAVRDQFGNDFVSRSDIAIGRLEVR